MVFDGANSMKSVGQKTLTTNSQYAADARYSKWSKVANSSRNKKNP